MREYKYVAWTDGYGVIELNDLIKEGWVPCRETAFRKSEYMGGVLVLFSRVIEHPAEEAKE